MDDAVIMKPANMSKGRLWTALAVILLGQFVVAIDLTVLNIALPDIAKDLNPTSDQMLWVVDVYSLVLAGMLVASSSLSDRIGRKTALLTGFFFFGAGSVLVLLVDSAAQLIALRAALGIGGSLIMPVTIAMVRNIFDDPKERSFAVAAWAAVGAIGMAVGPLIGGFLLEHFEWHSAFLVNVPLMGTAFLAGVFVLPEVKLKNPGKFDAVATLLALAGMMALMWGIKHVAAELEWDASGIAAIVGGVLLMALFATRCLKSKNPLVDLTLFRSRTFFAGVVGTAVCTFAMAALLYLLSQWLQVVNGDSSIEAGMHLLPMAIASLVSSAGAAWLATKFQARNVIAVGIGLAGAAMVMLVFFRNDLTLVPILAASTLVGIGTGALTIAASVMMLETPNEKASSAGSLQEVFYDFGNVLGVALLGSLASIVYRDGLDAAKLSAMGITGESADYVEQSIAGASEVANALGLPELMSQASAAFDDSLIATCLVGGIAVLAAAVLVWALIPKGLMASNAEDAVEETAEPPVVG